jgi:hypothetical protein
MKVYELETRNGRIFRVVVTNKSQEKRLSKVITDNKKKRYEVFKRIEVINNGIHDLKAFEQLARSLV